MTHYNPHGSNGKASLVVQAPTSSTSSVSSSSLLGPSNRPNSPRLPSLGHLSSHRKGDSNIDTHQNDYEDGCEDDGDDDDDDEGDDEDDDEDDDDDEDEDDGLDGASMDPQVEQQNIAIADSFSLIQPAPNPMPEPYIINHPTTHNTPPFSFESQLDIISPEILHDTVMSPVPQGKKFMCRIMRKNEGMDKRIYPTYELSLEDPIRPRPVYLLRATKKKRSRGSYYAITSDMDSSCDYSRKATEHSYGVLGKLRSNFLGTAFNVYSNGRNPFSSGSAGTDVMAETSAHPVNGGGHPDTSTIPSKRNSRTEKEKQHHSKEKDKFLPIRQELGAVIYNPNVLGLKGPRKMTILMNTMGTNGQMVESRPTQAKDTLIGRMTGDMTDLLVLRNKSPQWNDDTNSFVLNFGGRVSLASVKNFQIVHDHDLDYIIMQFGRTSQDTFTMDCQYPMTPFQAFAFALTSFDAKLACE
ncbi:hypothetical protein BG011_004826 [Mortierella polycephala]|uniref:Tubby C-terminal domain-containing protein n=1 Tax=Mortierella polycephala TaxID=41804 RepID=A0A9P6Q0I0_9FUNG|nr:hypothetical protein BG011_004826 [Mortierella polycephala]